MMNKFWAKTDWNFWTVDPDFDDDGLDLVSLRHEFETHGAVALHPNGNRRNGVDDPVPLCSFVPDGGKSSSEFMSTRLYLKEMQENQRYAMEARKRQRARENGAPIEFDFPLALADPMEVVLRNMRLHEPLAKGTGRVWRELVMIHEDDTKNANVENHDIKWTEVWRGRGYIIYRRDLERMPSWTLSTA